MNISARSTVGLIAAAVLATGLVTGTAIASAAGDPGGEKPPIDGKSSSFSETAALDHGFAGRELVYVPISPCRIVDTRKAGGKLAANATRSFYVSGATGFAAQGGASSGCGVPLAAAAASVALTSTQASGAGRVVAYPAGTTAPGALMLTYTASATVTSTPTIALTPGAAKQVTAKNFSSSTHLVVDVLGYYVPQMSAYINEDGSLWIGSSRVVSSARIDVGLYEVTFDTDITACNAVVSPATGGYTAGVFPDGAVAAVQITDIEGALADGYFNVVVIC